MSETSETTPPPEVIDHPVEIPRTEADTVTVAGPPRELPPMPDVPPEFDDTSVDGRDGATAPLADNAPSEAVDTATDAETGNPHASADIAPPVFDDTSARVSDREETTHPDDDPLNAVDASADTEPDVRQASIDDAPPIIDDTAVERSDGNEASQENLAHPDAVDAATDAEAEAPQGPAADAPPEFDDTALRNSGDTDLTQADDVPQKAADNATEVEPEENQAGVESGPLVLGDTSAEGSNEEGSEPADDARQDDADTATEATPEDPRATVNDASPEFEDTAGQGSDEPDADQADDVPPEADETVHDTGTEESEASADDALPEFDHSESEADQAGADTDESAAESVTDAHESTTDTKVAAEESGTKPELQDYDDTDDKSSGDRVTEHYRRRPPGSMDDMLRHTIENEPPVFDKEMMDLEVSESRELCRRIGDSYMDDTSSAVERRNDGSIRFTEYDVEVTPQGDAFGAHKDLRRWIADHRMSGSREDGCPYLEAHHLIPAAECREAGLDPDLAPCVAVQNDLHISMIHGGAGLASRPECSSVEGLGDYYEGFYDGLNAAAWSRRAGDYLQSNERAFASTLQARQVAAEATSAARAERDTERQAALAGVEAPPRLDLQASTDMAHELPQDIARMKAAAEAALTDSRMEKSIHGPPAYHETRPGAVYVRICPVNPTQGLDDVGFDINHISGRPEPRVAGTTPAIADHNARVDGRNAQLETRNAALKAKTEALLAERRAQNPSWTEVEAARVVLAESAATGEWWITLESYGRIHEHWAATSRDDPDYTLNDAFRDKLGLDGSWSPNGYDQTMLVRADFPVPCVLGMGNIHHRHMEVHGVGRDGPTGIEQIFVPRCATEALFRRGCYTTVHDPKQITLDQLKRIGDAQGDFTMSKHDEESLRPPRRIVH